MDFLSGTLLFLTIILIIGVVFLIWKNVSLSVNYIDPKNCPQVSGEFGVLPGVVGATKIQTIDQVYSLSNAITYCNQNPTICNVFSYNGSSMIFIDPTGTLTSDTSYDTYQRQYNTTISSN